ncbi:MAG: phosphohexomutase domain-containing protein [Planctomycetota bacterium]
MFGTDGVRAQAGTGPLTPDSIHGLGRALGRYLYRQEEGVERPRVLLGVDPRPSADMVGTSFASGLIAEKCDVHWPGMMSTPEVAYLTGHGPFSAGAMITASHNPSTDNGLKIFGSDGRKLSDGVESRLEKQVISGKATGPVKVKKGERFGWMHFGRDDHYEEFIVGTFQKSFRALKKRRLSIVVDAAYGARSIDLNLLSRLAHSIAFGRTVPDLQVGRSMTTTGENVENALDIYFLNASNPLHPETHHMINDGCGSTHPEGCAAAVKELGADLGICFDGDGDRCILIDENGEIRDGDYMLTILARDMKARGALGGNTVVSTVMANLGLEQALAKDRIKLVRTNVGDRHVFKGMDKHRATLGGEQSGHVIISDEGHLSGDGLYTALRIIEIILDSNKQLSELSQDISKCPQVLLNVKVKKKPALNTLRKTQAAIKGAKKALGKDGRVNVRYSGTEDLLRVMVEGFDEKEIKKTANGIASAARKEIGK